ncbi:MAG: hybrid sensor histidine kinase/response regulator [Leptospiraceae bacterium]|nr:hybrid sensor histidine kinase/response regulator [Leptospiraceae bacterium]MCP5495326.1 hybrid sensor histidine kinase/response regulator [Leptospiraceae bacterium]
MSVNEKKPRVLIVDDTPQNIEVIINILNSEFSLIIAKDGKQALHVLEKMIPDLILLDVSMPDMDGFEVCKILKNNSRTKDIPIIFLTARAESEDVVKGFHTGGADYVTKPFRIEELKARMNTHLKLRQKELQLQELNATKDKFFSIIAHDLKNPFSGIIGISDIILKNLKTMSLEKLEEMMQILHDSSYHGYRLLENLLEWSRTQTNSIGYKPENFYIKDILNQTYYLVKSNADQKNIRLSLEMHTTEQVYADPNMILTVVRNLVANAIKFTPKNGEIKVIANKQGNEIVVSIIDNGIGIEQENISKLFDIGSKLSNPGTENEKGTGLGLILCKEFVHINNGEINVKSELGKGSTFSFTLPQISDSDRYSNGTI